MAIFDKTFDRIADRISSRSSKKLVHTDKVEIAVLNNKTEYDFNFDNPSDVIANKGYDYMEEVRRDAHVSDALDIRSKGLLQHDWAVKPPLNPTDKEIEITQFVEWVIKNMEGSFLDDLNEIMDGIFYGYSISELIWGVCDQEIYLGKNIIKRIPSKHPKNWKFEINKKGNAYAVVNRNYDDKKIPLNKFLIATFGVSHKNPYGDPASAKVAFWYWLKRNSVQFWAVFLELWGSPTKVIKTPLNPSPEEKAAIDTLVNSFESATNYKIPEGFEVELLEASRSGSPEYDSMGKFCNSEISKAIIGSTLVNEEGNRGQGSYALGQTHSAILDMFIVFDSKKISTIINEQYIRPLVNLNYDVNGRYPEFHFPVTISKTVLLQNLQFMPNGMKISANWFHNYMGIPMAEAGEDILELQVPNNQGSQAAPIGESNNSGEDFSEKEIFSEEAENKKSKKLIKKKNKDVDEIVEYFSNEAYDVIEDIFKEVEKQIIDKSTVKGAEKFPEFGINIGKLNKLLTDQGMIAYTEGKGFALDQINSKLPKDDKVEFSERIIPIVFAESIFDNYFDGKDIITKAEFDKIQTELKNRYFTVAGIAKADIEKIFNQIMLALPEEWTVAEFKTAVEASKVAYIGTKNAISKDHVELIFHNAAMSAYTAGEEAMYNDPAIADEIWGYKYYGLADGKERAKHLLLNNITLPKNHSFWNKHTPPWDHNDRCGRIVVFNQDIKDGLEVQTEESAIPNVGNGWNK